MSTIETHYVQYEQIEVTADHRNLQNETETDSSSENEEVVLNPAIFMFFFISHLGGIYAMFTLFFSKFIYCL